MGDGQMQTQILGLVTPLMALFFAITFFVLWRVGRLRRYVLGIGVAFAFSAIGFLITHLSPADAPYVFHATQFFYSLGAVFMLASVCERVEQPLHLASMVGVYLICAFALGLFVSLSNDVGPRLVIVNMGYGIMFAMGVTTLLTAPGRSAMDVAIIAIMALQAADFLVRPSTTLLFERSIPAEVYRETIYYSLIGLVLGLKGVTTAIVLIGAAIADWMQNLRESTEQDSQTGLRNRGAFEERAKELLRRAESEDRPLSLVVADIDFFKHVNDTWGHQAGDGVISCFGQLVSKMVRDGDTAGRIGGEEFCVIVWDCEHGPAHQLAERIRQAFEEVKHLDIDDTVQLTASFGIATARQSESYSELFARADAALYRAKANGRNRVESAERQGIEEDLTTTNQRIAALELELSKRAVS